MVWSFSSVNNYANCPRCFYLTYKEKKSKVNNAFAQFGSFCHSLLERYFRGEAEFFELAQMYENEYNFNITIDFPEFKFGDLSTSYYEAGAEYFSSFEEWSEYEVLGVEQKITLDIKGKSFIGFIDLILRDKSDGSIVIVDHKSKSKFKSKKEKEHYLLQLYLYSIYIREKYGEYPKLLKFNMFRQQNIITEIFDEKKLLQAINWFDFTTDMIESDDSWACKRDDFFCHNLCGVRNHCEYGKE